MALTASQLKELRRHQGPKVAKALDLAGMTQAEVAEASGFTQPYISDLARERHQTITLDNARRIADVFGCSVDDLFPAKEAVA